MQKSKKTTTAQRLLERLKSPLLFLASQQPLNPKTPHPHHRFASPAVKQIARAVESLSQGRYTLARDQEIVDEELTHLSRVKIYDHLCGHYSWMTLAQMDALQERLKTWCAYCADEPISFRHIGNIDDVCRFVELRSGGKARFNPRNDIEHNDFTDIFAFNCLSPSCKGMYFETSFAWFLHESKPLTAFPDFPFEQTCGCPACTDIVKQKTASTIDESKHL